MIEFVDEARRNWLNLSSLITEDSRFLIFKTWELKLITLEYIILKNKINPTESVEKISNN